MQSNEMIETNRNLAELEALVKAFEDCTLDPVGFHHRDHLAVALWYETTNSESAPSDQFRVSLLRFVKHYQITVYHETITTFWIKIVHHFYRNCRNQRTLPEIIEELTERYGDHRIIYDYYSKELLGSEDAKARWVEPDLKKLC